MGDMGDDDLFKTPFFVERDQLSAEFRQRMAGVRTRDGVCFSCGEPIETIDQLGLILFHQRTEEGGLLAFFACNLCAQVPRAKLIEKAVSVPSERHECDD
jgi:hypothetical protein